MQVFLSTLGNISNIYSLLYFIVGCEVLKSETSVILHAVQTTALIAIILSVCRYTQT